MERDRLFGGGSIPTRPSRCRNCTTVSKASWAGRWPILFSFHDELGRCEINNSLILANVCRIGDTLCYVYDFGDNWGHLVTIEKEMRTCTGVVYPRCVAGRNACPPEDCGGPWGYAEMLRTLAGRRNARRLELIDWLGGPFDPKHFALEEANDRLTEYLEVSTPEPRV